MVMTPGQGVRFRWETEDDEVPAGVNYPGAAGGPAWVIAHGVTHGIDTPATRAVMTAFAAHGDVVAVDFRGNGRSTGRSSIGCDETADLDAAGVLPGLSDTPRWPSSGSRWERPPPWRHAAFGTHPGGPAGLRRAGSSNPADTVRVRKLVIALIVLLVLLVVADFGARAYAESRAADSIRSKVGTDVTPDVSIEGFPFLWHAVQGSYPQVVISASTTAADSIPGVRAVAELDTVALPLRDALAGDAGNLTAQSANVRALIPLDSLAAALGRPDLTLSAGPDGGIIAAATLTVAGVAIPLAGAATVSITDGELMLTVAHLSAAGFDLTPVAAAAADVLARQLSASLSLAGLPFAITDAVAAVRDNDLVLTVTTGAFTLSQLG